MGTRSHRSRGVSNLGFTRTPFSSQLCPDDLHATLRHKESKRSSLCTASRQSDASSCKCPTGLDCQVHFCVSRAAQVSRGPWMAQTLCIRPYSSSRPYSLHLVDIISSLFCDSAGFLCLHILEDWRLIGGWLRVVFAVQQERHPPAQIRPNYLYSTFMISSFSVLRLLPAPLASTWSLTLYICE